MGLPSAHGCSGIHSADCARRFADAYLLNRESNVFPGILGRVCDRPCEPACRRRRVEDEPVAICRLKRVAADNRGDISERLPQAPRQKNGRRSRADRRRMRLVDGRQRPRATRLRMRHFRSARGVRRADALEYSRRFACPRPCWTRRSATSWTSASSCVCRRRSRACVHCSPKGSMRYSSAAALQRARI